MRMPNAHKYLEADVQCNAWRFPLAQRKLWLPRFFYFGCLLLLGAYYPKFGRYATYDWIGLLAVLTTYGSYVFRGRFPKVHNAILLTLFLLIVGAAITIPNDPMPKSSTFSAVLMIYTLVIWISLPGIIFQSWNHIRLAMAVLSLSVVITVLYAMGHKFLGLPTFTPVYYWGRAVGLTRQPNELGTFCGMVFPYALALWVTTTSIRGKLLWIISALLAVLGVLLSGSMSAAFSLIAGTIAYYLVTSRRARKKTLILGFLGVAFLVGANATYTSKYTQSTIQRLARFATTSHGKLTLNKRLVADRYAWAYIKSNPLQGRGFHAKVRSIGRSIQVHNTFLRAWYDGGIFSLAGILVLFFGGGKILLRAWSQSVTSHYHANKPYIAALVGGFIGFVVMAQASPILYQRSALFPLALVFSLPFVMRLSQSKAYYPHD